jgi:hypothetical protein
MICKPCALEWLGGPAGKATAAASLRQGGTKQEQCLWSALLCDRSLMWHRLCGGLPRQLGFMLLTTGAGGWCCVVVMQRLLTHTHGLLSVASMPMRMADAQNVVGWVEVQARSVGCWLNVATHARGGV